MAEPNLAGARQAVQIILEAAKPAFEAKRNRAAFRQDAFSRLACSAFDPGGVEEIIAGAKAGDREARLAVRQAVAGFQAIGEPVPELLQSHVLEAYTAGVAAKRGPSKADRFARNAWIKLAVNAAMAYGLDRTRNNASSNRPCACSVVKEVLDELRLGHLTERALEDISK
jgi:hypothetical protein